MSIISDQYVIAGYWIYGYAEFDVEPTYANAALDGLATLLARGNAIFGLNAVLSCLAYVLAVGFRLGEEWNDESVGANTWTDNSVSSDVWMAKSIGSESWTDIPPSSNTWTDKNTGTNTWQLAE
jgi:hypothetical protein